MVHDDSKELWLSIDQKMRPELLTLGRYSTQAYLQDPIRISFISSRYKFCSRLLKGRSTALEIGCGDGFGSAMVAQNVRELIATDINENLLADNRKRMTRFSNLSFIYHDFRAQPFPRKVDSIYLIDTIEHIYPEEERAFMENLTATLTDRGVCLIGTPNKTADQYANNWSREGHVNLKNYDTLMKLGLTYFYTVFFFGMNDEIVHTGYPPMSHFIWILCVDPKRE